MFKYYLSFLFSVSFFLTTKAQTTITLLPLKDNVIYQNASENSNGVGQGLFRAIPLVIAPGEP